MFLGKNKEILDEEIQTILEALVIAKKWQSLNSNNHLILLSKSIKVIVLPFTSQEYQFLKSQVYRKMKKLQQSGHPITFQQIPSHFSPIKNEIANLSTSNSAESGKKLTKKESLLAYIKRNIYRIRSKNLVKWHK